MLTQSFRYIRRAVKKSLDMIYPQGIYCICCGSVIDSSRIYSICDDCIQKFEWINEDKRTCKKCGKLLRPDYIHEICVDCRENEHYFDHGYTCCQYGLYERTLMMDLKYGGKSYLGNIIGEIISDRLLSTLQNDEEEKISENWDMILPVPIHKKRMSKRGFNQTEIISTVIARKLGILTDKSILVREKNTKVMKNLGVIDRKFNLKNAFAVRDAKYSKLTGKNILLVDDIYTTGATVDEVSKVLKEAGAEKIDVVTFAAGGNVVGKHDI